MFWLAEKKGGLGLWLSELSIYGVVGSCSLWSRTDSTGGLGSGPVPAAPHGLLLLRRPELPLMLPGTPVRQKRRLGPALLHEPLDY